MGFLCGGGESIGGGKGLCFSRYICIMTLESSSLFSPLLLTLVAGVWIYGFGQSIFYVWLLLSAFMSSTVFPGDWKEEGDKCNIMMSDLRGRGRVRKKKAINNIRHTHN